MNRQSLKLSSRDICTGKFKVVLLCFKKKQVKSDSFVIGTFILLTSEICPLLSASQVKDMARLILQKSQHRISDIWFHIIKPTFTPPFFDWQGV